MDMKAECTDALSFGYICLLKSKYMSLVMQQLQETTNFIRERVKSTASVGIILGSGLGNLANEIITEFEIAYNDIPHFPVSTVEGHKGKLIFGELGGKKVWVMGGRFHFYEGYTPMQVAYPVRVMRMLGVETLLLSNAAGGVNPNFSVGDLMIIKDHISFFTVNPLLGKNEDAIGTRFPDMSEPYSKSLIQIVKDIARKNDIKVHEGVYTGVTGPTFETRAEYKLIHVLGGDAVGMSTVQETITAVHCGMKVFAMSVITDLGIREEENVITHEEVLQAATDAEPKLTLLFRELIQTL
jgi:purine-nucleoside phosphorylase